MIITLAMMMTLMMMPSLAKFRHIYSSLLYKSKQFDHQKNHSKFGDSPSNWPKGVCWLGVGPKLVCYLNIGRGGGWLKNYINKNINI